MSTSDRLDLAHPDETKERARKAYEQHGSVRKAAAEAGVPKSTLHRWITTHKWGDPLTVDKDSTEPSEPVNSFEPSNTPPPGEGDTQSDFEARMETQQAGADTDGPGDPTSNLPDPHDPLGDGSSPGNLEELDQLEESTTIPHRLYLQAIYRYMSLLSSGVHPDRAVDAVKSIDPSFYVNPDDHRRIEDALRASGFDPQELTDYMPAKLRASEASILRFANPNPPGYVQDIVDTYSMSDDDIANLADQIYALRLQSYTFGINQQLTKLGLPTVTDITDSSVLSDQRDLADAAARQIAQTWNRDAASTAGASWIDAIGSTARSDNLVATIGTRADDRAGSITDDMSAWADGRADWKGQQIAGVEGNHAYVTAVQDFLGNNPDLGVSASVVPDDCVCDGCQALVDLGEMSIDDAQALPLPLHPGCVHEIEVHYAPDMSMEDVWSGQESAA